MTTRLLLGLLIFTSLQTLAQDKNWSLEANYPISIGDELGSDSPGIIDLGLKYRFKEWSFARLGIGANVSLFDGKTRSFTNPEIFDFEETNFLIQPRVFADFKIPALEKFHPSVGIGYTIVTSRFDGFLNDEDISGSDSDGGLNLNLGVGYDLSRSIFVQTQYDIIWNSDGESNNNQTLGILKFGLGLRF